MKGGKALLETGQFRGGGHLCKGSEPCPSPVLWPSPLLTPTLLPPMRGGKGLCPTSSPQQISEVAAWTLVSSPSARPPHWTPGPRGDAVLALGPTAPLMP